MLRLNKAVPEAIYSTANSTVPIHYTCTPPTCYLHPLKAYVPQPWQSEQQQSQLQRVSPERYTIRGNV